MVLGTREVTKRVYSNTNRVGAKHATLDSKNIFFHIHITIL